MALSRADILSFDDRKPVSFPVPEWGGEVLLRPLSGTQRDQVEAMVSQDGPGAMIGVRARILAMSVVDDGGRPLFSESDVQEIGNKSGAVLDRLLLKIRQISGMGKDAVDEAKKD